MTHAWKCKGKHRFASAALASEVGRRQRTGAQGNRKRENNRSAYHCPYCGGWHLGTDFGRTRRLRKRAGVSDKDLDREELG